MNLKHFFMTTVLAGAVAVPAMMTPAEAATCSQGNITFTLTQGNPDAVQDQACFAGNNNNTIDASFVLFGKTGWVLAATSNDGSGDQDLTFDTPVPAPLQTLWSILNPKGYSEIVMTLKQGNAFAAFLLDSAEALNGVWGTNGPGQSVDDLSHASIYHNGDPSTVPVPAAGWLMIAGLGGLATLRRRKAA